jgi:hypothetical protein
MFKHPEQALRFAFKTREKVIVSMPKGVYAERINTPSHDQRTLTAYDFHAQVGMIMAYLERRPPLEQAYVFLEYGTPLERKFCARYIANHSDIRLPSMLTNRTQLRQALLGNSVRKVAHDIGISNYKAWKLRKELWSLLEPIMLRLYDSMYEWMDLNEYPEQKETT